MIRSSLPVIAMLLAAVMFPADTRAELDKIKEDPNLQRRSRLALDFAHEALDSAREAYQKGESNAVSSALDEVRESIELAYQSLQDTGRPPRRMSGRYKQGEIRSRELLRRLDTFKDEMSYLDREKIESVIEVIKKVHHDFLMAVMGGGR